MNIPIQILKKVTSSTFAFHQILSKKIMKIQHQKSIVSFKKSIDQEEAPNPSLLQCKVLTWFFNQELATRLKLCSIQNKYLILILHQMKIMNQKYVNNIYFKIIPECKEEVSLDKLHYGLFYQKIEPRFINMHKNEGREAEEQLIKEIRFLTGNEYNDIITLSNNLIQNEDLFKRLFFIISKRQCFEESIKAYQEEDEKYYNFDFPFWVRKKSELTFGQILLMLFEQVILINYTHHYYFNELYSYPYYDKIQEIIDTSATLITFISESSNKVELYNTILFNGIRKAIKEDAVICELLKKHEEPMYELYPKKIMSEQIDDTNMKLRNIYLDTYRFITEITFISFSNLFKVEDFVYKKILKHFIGLYQEKNVEDLLNDEEEKIKTDNKKKKKRKKKKIKIKMIIILFQSLFTLRLYRKKKLMNLKQIMLSIKMVIKISQI